MSQVLSQWKGKFLEEATWIDSVDIYNQFPGFRLKDKANIQQGGNDMDTSQQVGLGMLRVYTRRKKTPEDGIGMENSRKKVLQGRMGG